MAQMPMMDFFFSIFLTLFRLCSFPRLLRWVYWTCKDVILNVIGNLPLMVSQAPAAFLEIILKSALLSCLRYDKDSRQIFLEPIGRLAFPGKSFFSPGDVSSYRL
jgi:hypothetical protein